MAVEPRSREALSPDPAQPEDAPTRIVEGPASGEQEVSAGEARAFREAALDNGYALIRLRMGSKAPAAAGWQDGESADVLLDVKSTTANTGLRTAGLRCIDIDVDDPKLVLRIFEELRRCLPPAKVLRRRDGSPRSAILYRAEKGEPRKVAVAGPRGKVEVLGAGQQVMVHGLHPSGARLRWLYGRGPDTVALSELPTVSEQQIRTFLNACSPLLGVARAHAFGVERVEQRRRGQR